MYKKEQELKTKNEEKEKNVNERSTLLSNSKEYNEEKNDNKNESENNVVERKIEKEKEGSKIEDGYQVTKDKVGEKESSVKKEENVFKKSKELQKPEEMSEKLLAMNSPDYTAHAIVESVLNSVKRENEINAANKELLLNIVPLNEWRVESLMIKSQTVKVVNSIPRMISIVSEKSDNDSDFSKYAKSAGLEMNSEFLNDCISTFRSGTREVKFVISTKDAYKNIQYDPESKYTSTFKIEGYSIITGEQKFFGTSELDTLCSLLTLIFEIKDIGNVAVVNPMVEIFFDRDDNVNIGPLVAWKNKKIPSMSVPHILFGTYKHPLKWFVDHVRGEIQTDDVKIGEHGNLEFDPSNNKISSYYGVTTDNFFCDLYELHQQKIESQTVNPSEIVNLMNSYTPRGTRVQLQSDSQIRYSHAFFPNLINAQQYAFAFLLSQPLRMTIRGRLEEMITNMKGLKNLGFNEISQLMYSTVQIPNSDTSLDKIFTSGAENLSIRHFYQMMVINKFHAFINAEGTFPFECTTPYHAIAALLYVLADALIFPAYFWTNVHIYVYTIYKAFEQLDFRAYNKLIEGGYTKSYDLPIVLTRAEILNGEVPKIFANRQLPFVVSEYMSLLNPIGILVDNGKESFSVVCLSEQRKTYIPFKPTPRSRVSTVSDTLFSDRIRRFKGQMSSIIAAIAKKERIGIVITTNLSSQLIGALNTIFDVSMKFGATAHYELESIYRALQIGPEVPYETYFGAAEVNLSLPIGLISNSNTSHRAVLASDVTKVYPGAGMYALMTIVGDHVSKSGGNKVDLRGVQTYMHKNTIDRIHEYVTVVKNVETLGEQFGILSHILQASNDDDDPWSIFVKLFGRTFKSGLATQILAQLLQVSNIKEMTSSLIDEDKIVATDLRLNNPMVCDVSTSGHATNQRKHVNEYFNKPFELLSVYEKRKLEISLELVSGINSPIHRYIRGLTVKRQTFDELSPSNRHSEPDIIIEHNEDLFEFKVIDKRSFAGINYNGNFFYRINDDTFPKGLGIEISNPAIISQEIWDFLNSCVEGANWMIIMPVQLALAEVRRVDSSYVKNGMTDWSVLRNSIAGSTVNLSFYDTYDPMVNYKTHVNPNGYWQYVCALDPVERNVLARSIEGIYGSEGFMQIDRDNWVFGNCIPGELSRATNNYPKYKLGKVNFNNLMKVWTKYVDFEKYPRMQFVNINDNYL